MGIQITGPIAQSVLAAYDDLWSDSDLIICGRTDYGPPMLFFFFCTAVEAQPGHTPEILRFYPQEPSPYSSAFALHHTRNTWNRTTPCIAAILAAEDTIDLFEVNFSLETACVVGILLDLLCFRRCHPALYGGLAHGRDRPRRQAARPDGSHGHERL